MLTKEEREAFGGSVWYLLRDAQIDSFSLRSPAWNLSSVTSDDLLSTLVSPGLGNVGKYTPMVLVRSRSLSLSWFSQFVKFSLRMLFDTFDSFGSQVL